MPHCHNTCFYQPLATTPTPCILREPIDAWFYGCHPKNGPHNGRTLKEKPMAIVKTYNGQGQDSPVASVCHCHSFCSTQMEAFSIPRADHEKLFL